MSKKEIEIRGILSNENEEFKRLEQKHHQYDDQLGNLSKLSYLTPEQEREEVEIKKLKLKVKDEMAIMVKQYQKSL
ncbi:MAG: DUF465 domain-containing protein [bacterium]